MDRFQEMTVFEAVADELSLAAAARRLYLSPPTVTRAIDALEQRLGIKLLQGHPEQCHQSLLRGEQLLVRTPRVVP